MYRNKNVSLNVYSAGIEILCSYRTPSFDSLFTKVRYIYSSHSQPISLRCALHISSLNIRYLRKFLLRERQGFSVRKQLPRPNITLQRAEMRVS
jgi:hypothetical protein